MTKYFLLGCWLIFLCLLPAGLASGEIDNGCCQSEPTPSTYDICKPCEKKVIIMGEGSCIGYPGGACCPNVVTIGVCNTLLGKGLYQGAGSTCGCHHEHGGTGCGLKVSKEGYYFTCDPKISWSAFWACAFGAGAGAFGCLSSLVKPDPASVGTCLCGAGLAWATCDTCVLFPCEQTRTRDAYQVFVTSVTGTCPPPAQ